LTLNPLLSIDCIVDQGISSIHSILPQGIGVSPLCNDHWKSHMVILGHSEVKAKVSKAGSLLPPQAPLILDI